ncbi:hypothetical protein [Bacillus sp. Marseille-P3661]|uniref:hypothetical protein n=1 Tax=Bacillus sp. Marseille-P3661 TaxID=1936234 RepID=UPI000C8449C4|nr:hypothetical protein [Bacillus sp. Marseille-P3661]
MYYKILYCKWLGGQRKVTVFNFKLSQIIEFTIDELDELDEDLKRYIKSNWESILAGHWDYSK